MVAVSSVGVIVVIAVIVVAEERLIGREDDREQQYRQMSSDWDLPPRKDASEDLIESGM